MALTDWEICQWSQQWGQMATRGETEPLLELEMWHQDSSEKSQKQTTERPEQNFSFSETELQRRVGLPRKMAEGQ